MRCGVRSPSASISGNPMQAGGFIARRLRVKEKMAVLAIAISFFVIILSVAISAGFRRVSHGNADFFPTGQGQRQCFFRFKGTQRGDHPIASPNRAVEGIALIPLHDKTAITSCCLPKLGQIKIINSCVLRDLFQAQEGFIRKADISDILQICIYFQRGQEFRKQYLSKPWQGIRFSVDHEVHGIANTEG